MALRLTWLRPSTAALLAVVACATSRPAPTPSASPSPPPDAAPPPPTAPAPDAIPVLVSRAEAIVRDGGDPEALAAVLAELRARSPDEPRLDALDAARAELTGDDAAAAEAWDRAAARTGDPELRLKRALALSRLHRDADAERDLRVVLYARPGDRAARGALSEVLERGGRVREAEEELLAIAALAPTDPGPQRDLAAFYRRHGEASRADEAERRARELTGPPRALRPLRGAKR